MSREILNSKDIGRTLTRVSHEILEKNREVKSLCLVGIQRGGVYLAGRIAGNIQSIEGIEVPVGSLDISMYRDDLNIRNGYPAVRKTEIDFELTGKVVVLVDDVLFTGRSIRAAMDALMDMGRPSKIELAVLIDRGHRELPIRADFVGKNIPTYLQESIDVELSEEGKKDRVLIRTE